MLDIVETVIDKFIPDAAKRLEMKNELIRLEAAQATGQLEVNKVEAAHASTFVAGWRPAIGWTLALGFATNIIFFPVWERIEFTIAVRSGAELQPFPEPLDLTQMMPVLLGMLGLGGMRSWEKSKGVARDVLKIRKKKK